MFCLGFQGSSASLPDISAREEGELWAIRRPGTTGVCAGLAENNEFSRSRIGRLDLRRRWLLAKTVMACKRGTPHHIRLVRTTMWSLVKRDERGNLEVVAAGPGNEVIVKWFNHFTNPRHLGLAEPRCCPKENPNQRLTGKGLPHVPSIYPDFLSAFLCRNQPERISQLSTVGSDGPLQACCTSQPRPRTLRYAARHLFVD